MDAKIFRVNYKSDFILTLESDAGWMTPFCIKFWTGAPSQAYYVGWDGETYTHCSFDPSEPTKLLVQFDDHHLPIGDLKYQVAYHFTVSDFPNDTEDEVINPANITTEIDGETYQVMLDFTGETAPEIQFSLPAYANEAQRIANEEQRIANEEQRIAAEQTRIQNEQTRINQEQTRQQNETRRIQQEQARVDEYAGLKADAVAATGAANDAAALANQKAQLAADKAALAQAAADFANAKAQLASDKAALAASAAQLANDKAALAQQKAEYAMAQGNYAKDQGDYAKEQGDTALADHQRAEADHGIAVDDHTQAGNDHTRAESDHGIAVDDHTQAGNDHTRAESDHGIAVDDHTQAGNDHTRAESDHGIAVDDHTQAGNDHTRAESDHTRAESDHDAVEVFVDSLGVFDLSKHNAVGGVLATYADLDAALTALNALESKYKYGGMSFKFVLSSDNKYIQARCMAQNFTTDITQWQGVDSEPVAGSQNLVKSGGVETELNKVIPCNIVSTQAGTTFYPYKFVSGHKYIIVNNSSRGINLKLSPDETAGSTKQDVGNLSAGEKSLFTANNDYNYAAVYFNEAASVTIYDYNVYLENEDDINKSLGFKKQLAIPTLKRGKYYQVLSPDYKITVVDSIDESIYFDAIDVSAYIGKYINVVFADYVTGGGRKIAIGTLNATTDSYVGEGSPTSLVDGVATYRLLITGNYLYISYTDVGKYITSIYVEDYTQVGSEIDKINNTIIGLLPKNAVKIERISKNIFNLATDYLADTFVNNSGNVVSQTDWGVAKISVTEGMIITFGHTILGRDVYAAYYLGSLKVSMFDVTESEGVTGKTVTVPSGVDTLYIDIKTNGTPDGGYEDFTVNVGSILYPYDEYQTAVTKILEEKLYAINSGDENKHVNEDMFSQPSYMLVKSRCSVNFSFDDSTIQDEDIKAIFDEFGLKCGFAIINGYNRYRQYAEEGFEILAHGGGSYSEASETTIRAAMVAGKKVVTDLGLVCHGWVTPSSQLPVDLTWVTNDYFEYGFTIYKGNDSTPANQLISDTQKSYNLWRIHMDTLMSNYQNILDYAVQNDGVISIYGHGYELEGSGWDLNDLRTILQYCKTNGIEVLSPYRSFLKLFSDRHN